MAYSSANNGRPKANEKHNEGVVISIDVSIALGQAVYGKKENALQVEVKTTKVFESRNHLISKSIQTFHCANMYNTYMSKNLKDRLCDPAL